MAHDLLEALCIEEAVYGAHCKALDRGAAASAGARRGRMQASGETGCQKSSTEHVAFLVMLRGRINSAPGSLESFENDENGCGVSRKSGRDGVDGDRAVSSSVGVRRRNTDERKSRKGNG